MKAFRAVVLLAVLALGLAGAVSAADSSCCPVGDCCSDCAM